MDEQAGSEAQGDEASPSRGGLRLPGPAAALALGVVVLGAIGFGAHFFGGGSLRRTTRFGTIQVDQPEIYTRERLVNDRFEQDDWLRTRLGKTNELSFDAHARVQAASSRSRSAETRAGSEPDAAAPAAPAAEPGEAPAPVGSDPIDDFRDRVAYREEVRSEIIENQLDDTHDIAGNTLYHLKFDTAIIPFDEHVTGFAIVDAAVNGPTPRYFTCEPVLLDQEGFDACAEAFVQDLRLLALKMATERLPTQHAERTEPPSTELASVAKLRDQALARELSEEIRERRDERRILNEELRKIASIRDEGLKVAALTKLAEGSGLLRQDTRIEEQRLVAGVREQFEQAYELYQDWLEQASLEVNIAMRSKRSLIQSALADLNATTASLRAATEVERLEIAAGFLRDVDLGELDDFEKYLRGVSERDDACSKREQARLSARAGFLKTVDCLLGNSDDERPYEARFEESYAKWFADNKTRTAPADYRALVQVEGYGPSVRLRPQTITTPRGFTAPPWAAHAEQLHLIKIESATPSPTPGAPEPEPVENIVRQVGFARFLTQLHRASNRAYTYSVRPKEAVERISNQTSTAALSQLAAGIGGKLGPEAMKSLVSDARAESLLTAALERHPLVVGFSRDAERSVSGWAYFGWLLGPRFSGGSADAKRLQFAHRASHQSLSVIISAPSWWREATVVLLTYWLSDDGRCFSTDGEPFACSEPDRLKNKQIKLRLPGDAEAVSEVLLPADLRKSPKVDEGSMAAIDVWEGAPADVVIPGRHLWRSTVVTLGNQRADRIAVLPDMNGIVAHFDSVVLPPTPSPGPSRPAIYLWTSEGHCRVKSGKVSIHPKPAAATSAVAADGASQHP